MVVDHQKEEEYRNKIRERGVKNTCQDIKTNNAVFVVENGL